MASPEKASTPSKRFSLEGASTAQRVHAATAAVALPSLTLTVMGVIVAARNPAPPRVPELRMHAHPWAIPVHPT